jgi:hypothetical protein
MQLAVRQATQNQSVSAGNIDYEGIDQRVDGYNFEQCEKVITWGLQRFYHVGKALMRIKENKWYKSKLGFNSFEEYCDERWGLKKSYAYRLIQSAEVLDDLSPIGDGDEDEGDYDRLLERPTSPVLPATESQARELARLETKKERIEAWREITATYEPEEITARDVAEIVKRRKAEQTAQEEDASVFVRAASSKANTPKFTLEQIEAAFERAFKSINLTTADADDLFILLRRELNK